jgi:hypothetical protein
MLYHKRWLRGVLRRRPISTDNRSIHLERKGILGNRDLSRLSLAYKHTTVHLHQLSFSFLVSCGGVRLSPFVTSATNWSIAPAPDDTWWWIWSSRRNENWQRKPKYSEKTCPNATLSTTNPTWSDLGSNRGYRDGKPATNRLSYGTAYTSLHGLT